MIRVNRFALPLLGAGLVAFIASPALAHCGKCAGSCKDMVKAMGEGKVTLAKAVDAGAAACKGTAIGASTAIANGKASFTVQCLAGDKVVEVPVDGTGKAGTAADAKGADAAAAKGAAKAMGDAKATLNKSMEAAEAATKGTALYASSKAAGDKLTVEVYCLAGDKIMKTDVDGTGKAGTPTEAKELPGAAKPPVKGG